MKKLRINNRSAQTKISHPYIAVVTAFIVAVLAASDSAAQSGWTTIYSSSATDAPSAPNLVATTEGTLVAAFSERTNSKVSVKTALLSPTGNIQVSTIADQWFRATSPGITYIPKSFDPVSNQEFLAVQFGGHQFANNLTDPFSTGRLVTARANISDLTWSLTPNASANQLAVESSRVESILLSSGTIATIFAPGTDTVVGDELTVQFGDTTTGSTVNLNPSGSPSRASIVQDEITGDVVASCNSDQPAPAGTFYISLVPTVGTPTLIPESGDIATSFVTNSNITKATALAASKTGGIFSLFCQVGSFPCKILRLNKFNEGTVSSRIQAARGLEINYFSLQTFADDRLWPAWIESRGGVAGYEVVARVTDKSFKAKSSSIRIPLPKKSSLDRLFGFEIVSLGRKLWAVALMGDSTIGYRYIARQISEPASLTCSGITGIRAGKSSNISCTAKDLDGKPIAAGTVTVKGSNKVSKKTNALGKAGITTAVFRNVGTYSVEFSKQGFEKVVVDITVR